MGKEPRKRSLSSYEEIHRHDADDLGTAKKKRENLRKVEALTRKKGGGVKGRRAPSQSPFEEEGETRLSSQKSQKGRGIHPAPEKSQSKFK